MTETEPLAGQFEVGDVVQTLESITNNISWSHLHLPGWLYLVVDPIWYAEYPVDDNTVTLMVLRIGDLSPFARGSVQVPALNTLLHGCICDSFKVSTALLTAEEKKMIQNWLKDWVAQRTNMITEMRDKLKYTETPTDQNQDSRELIIGDL